MNKLITKIVGTCLGLAMAAGTGVAAAAGASKETVPVQAATITTWTRVTSVSTLTSGGTFIMGYEATANSGTIVPLRSDGANATTSANGYFQTGTTSGSSGNGTISVTENASYTAYEVYITASTNTSGAINIQMGSSSGNFYGASSSGNSKNTGRLYTSGNSAETDITVTLGSNDHFTLTSAVTGSYKYMKYNTGSPRYAFYNSSASDTVFYKKGTQESSSPTISLSSDAKTIAAGNTSTVTVTYSDLTSALNVVSDDTDVATVSLANSVSSGSGSVVMTISAEGEGTATITVSSTGATSKTVSVSVYEEKEFTRIVSAAKVVSGGHYLIAKTGSTTIMSTTQNSNNRGVTTASGSDPYSTLTTSGSAAAIITITAGTGDNADYYTLYDSVNSGYLYAPTGGNYLRTGTDLTSYYYWSISFEDNHAVISNVGNSGRVIRNNGTLMSAYASGQTAVDLYLLTSEVPVDVSLTSITVSNASVEVGSVIEFSGSYLPINATEAITIKTLDTDYATAGSITMLNGDFSVSITGVSATEGTTLTFEGENGNGTATVTLTVTSYVGTHTLVTTSSSLANGSKVIIGCTDESYSYSAEKSTGGNNLNGAVTGFAADKSTLAAAETSQEFVMWKVDTTNNYWVLSDGGYYLQAPSSANNYLQRTDVLSANCYFTLTNDASGVVVTSNYHNTYTIQFNSGTSKFSLYATTQKSASLYLSSETVDPIQGFVDVFMHMDTYSSNSGYCADETHHYYTDAKAGFAQLSAAQRQTFCTDSAYADAYARLSWWASNNGEKIDESYALVQKSNSALLGFNSIENNGVTSIVIIVSLIGLAAIGGYFFIRKRKEQ